MRDPERLTNDELERYVWNLPEQLARVIKIIKAGTADRTTYDLRSRSHHMFMAVRNIWLSLAEKLPPNLFDTNAGDVFDRAINPRMEIYRVLQEPDGIGSEGTVARQMVSASLFEDAKQFVRIAAATQINLAVDSEKLRQWSVRWSDIDVSY